MFIAWGGRAVEYLREKGVPSARIIVAPPAVPKTCISCSRYEKDALKRKWGVAGKKVVLFMGYFTKRKGVLDLVKAFTRLGRTDAVLIMAGDGPEMKRIKPLITGRSDVLLPGYVEGRVKAECYAIADLFVLPSYVDAWGLVVNEAMEAGLPVITTTGVGASELVKENGIVLPPGDHNALSFAIAHLLEDDGLRARMGEFSKALIANYTIENAARAITEGVKRAVEARRRNDE
jgi:glycosyltransferase involved in cell wall biosynthesis